MGKKKKSVATQHTNANDIGRGTIQDNFLAALVTSKQYKMQVVKAKKGKGSYQRKNKHVRRESYLMAA
ncbi:MAG: alternative ribosome rescue factor ArfA [Psychrobium sp.]